MTIDGTAIARELRSALRERIKKNVQRYRLALVIAEETREIRTFVELKQRFAQEIGIETSVLTLNQLHRKTEDLLALLLHATREHDGVVVQLPLGRGMDTEALLNIYPLSHDVDVLGNTAFEQYREGKLPFDPPVVGAMAEILRREGVHLAGCRALVIGEGRLVGAPAAIWAERMRATVKVVNKTTPRFDEWVRGSDVIICGAGSPGIIHPDNIKEGAIILDAGTSESEGVLKGDADPACAEKARIFTPTPGGIGPITVAKVFENLLALVALKEKRKNP